MFLGPPLPLLPDFPVHRLITLLDARARAGAWLRGSRTYRLHARSFGRVSDVLIAGDLGVLLQHCTCVVLREGAQAVLLQSELLLGWRALQVVTGTPYLPCLQRLKELFPTSEMDHLGFRVPTRSCPPEAVLAECLLHGIPVAESRIIYRPPGRHSSR
jgi:hypothetical protein